MYLVGRKLVIGLVGCVSFFFYIVWDVWVLMCFLIFVECIRFYFYCDFFYLVFVDIGYSYFYVFFFSELFC